MSQTATSFGRPSDSQMRKAAVEQLIDRYGRENVSKMQAHQPERFHSEIMERIGELGGRKNQTEEERSFATSKEGTADYLRKSGSFHEGFASSAVGTLGDIAGGIIAIQDPQGGRDFQESVPTPVLGTPLDEGGTWGGLFGQAYGSGLASAPAVFGGPAVATGTLLGLGASAYGSARMELMDRRNEGEEFSSLQEHGLGIAYFASEFGSELLGRFGLKFIGKLGATQLRKIVSEAAEKGGAKAVWPAIKGLLTIPAGMTEEGAEEVVNTIAQNAAANWITGAGKPYTEGVGHAFLVGAIAGGGLVAGSTGIQSAQQHARKEFEKTPAGQYLGMWDKHSFNLFGKHAAMGPADMTEYASRVSDLMERGQWTELYKFVDEKFEVMKGAKGKQSLAELESAGGTSQTLLARPELGNEAIAQAEREADDLKKAKEKVVAKAKEEGAVAAVGMPEDNLLTDEDEAEIAAGEKATASKLTDDTGKVRKKKVAPAKVETAKPTTTTVDPEATELTTEDADRVAAGVTAPTPTPETTVEPTPVAEVEAPEGSVEQLEEALQEAVDQGDDIAADEIRTRLEVAKRTAAPEETGSPLDRLLSDVAAADPDSSPEAAEADSLLAETRTEAEQRADARAEQAKRVAEQEDVVARLTSEVAAPKTAPPPKGSMAARSAERKAKAGLPVETNSQFGVQVPVVGKEGVEPTAEDHAGVISVVRDEHGLPTGEVSDVRVDSPRPDDSLDKKAARTLARHFGVKIVWYTGEGAVDGSVAKGADGQRYVYINEFAHPGEKALPITSLVGHELVHHLQLAGVGAQQLLDIVKSHTPTYEAAKRYYLKILFGKKDLEFFESLDPVTGFKEVSDALMPKYRHYRRITSKQNEAYMGSEAVAVIIQEGLSRDDFQKFLESNYPSLWARIKQAIRELSLKIFKSQDTKGIGDDLKRIIREAMPVYMHAGEILNERNLKVQMRAVKRQGRQQATMTPRSASQKPAQPAPDPAIDDLIQRMGEPGFKITDVDRDRIGKEEDLRAALVVAQEQGDDAASMDAVNRLTLLNLSHFATKAKGRTHQARSQKTQQEQEYKQADLMAEFMVLAMDPEYAAAHKDVPINTWINTASKRVERRDNPDKVDAQNTINASLKAFFKSQGWGWVGSKRDKMEKAKAEGWAPPVSRNVSSVEAAVENAGEEIVADPVTEDPTTLKGAMEDAIKAESIARRIKALMDRPTKPSNEELQSYIVYLAEKAKLEPTSRSFQAMDELLFNLSVRAHHGTWNDQLETLGFSNVTMTPLHPGRTKQKYKTQAELDQHESTQPDLAALRALIQKAMAEPAGQQTVGAERSYLANISKDDKVRRWVSSYDEAAQDLLIPKIKPRHITEQNAQVILSDPALLADAQRAVDRGEGINDNQTVAMAWDAERAISKAIATNDQQDFIDARTAIHRYRRARTLAGRTLQAGTDPFLGKRERMRMFGVGYAVSSSKQGEADMNRLHDDIARLKEEIVILNAKLGAYGPAPAPGITTVGTVGEGAGPGEGAGLGPGEGPGLGEGAGPGEGGGDIPGGARVFIEQEIAEREAELKEKIADLERVHNQEQAILNAVREKVLRDTKVDIFNEDELNDSFLDDGLTVRISRAAAQAKGENLDPIFELFNSMLLAGPQTNMVNALSSAANIALEYMLLRPIQIAIANTLGVAGIKVEGAPSFKEYGPMIRAVKRAFLNAGTNARISWREERPVLEMGMRGEDVKMKMVGRSKTAIPGRTGKAVRAGFYVGGGGARMLRAVDEFNKSLIFHIDLAAISYRLAMKMDRLNQERYVLARMVQNSPAGSISEKDEADFIAAMKAKSAEEMTETTIGAMQTDMFGPAVTRALHMSRLMTFSERVGDQGGVIDTMGRHFIQIRDKFDDGLRKFEVFEPNSTHRNAAWRTINRKGAKVLNPMVRLLTSTVSPKFLMPYAPTMTNLLRQGTEYIPGSIISDYLRYATHRASSSRDESETDPFVTREKLTRRGAQQVVGGVGSLALFAVVFGLFSDDDEEEPLVPFLTGARPHDAGNRARREHQYQTSISGQSIRVGPFAMEYSRFDPFGLSIATLATTAESAKGLHRGASFGKTMRQWWQDWSSILRSRNMVEGVDRLVRAFEDPQYWPSYFTDHAAAFSPNSLKQYMRAFDNHIRQRTTRQEFIETKDWWTETMRSAGFAFLPEEHLLRYASFGAGDEPPIRVDALGRDIKRSSGNLLVRSINPFKIKVRNDLNLIADKISQYNRVNAGDDPFYLQSPTNVIERNGERVRIGWSDHYKLSKLSGMAFADMATRTGWMRQKETLSSHQIESLRKMKEGASRHARDVIYADLYKRGEWP